jgi:Domain of unknown function (DUF4167)
LLNNRQAGRRRGRGGQRQPSGGRENGNRIDNRARGNAPQMLEKYKALARDAQLAGDRVMTEYYLQFADHYFRVTAEMRARFEENRRPRDDWQGDEGEEGDDQGLNENDGSDAQYGDEGEDDRQPPRRNEPRADYRNEPRADRADSRDRGANDRPRERSDTDRVRERSDPDRSPERSDNDRAERAPRSDRNGARNGGERGSNDRNRDRYAGNRNRDDDDRQPDTGTIDVAVLPPAFGSDGMISPIVDFEPAETEAPPAPKRRGRPRRVAVEGDTPAEG